MGTKAIYGFVKNGKRKIAYAHLEGSPDSLGEDVVKFIKSTTVKELHDIYENIILVDNDTPPTDEQKEACRAYWNLSVSEKSLDDWYCLLRGVQGNLFPYKEGFKYMMDGDISHHYYEYQINLDSNTYNVFYFKKLMGKFDLENIPENWVEKTEEKYEKSI